MTEQKSRSLVNDLPECPPEIVGGGMVSSDSSSIPLLDFPADPELVADGWERRFMADPPRAEEARIIYTELGYEVRAEAIKPSELSVLCGDCRLATCKAYVTLYTRRSPP
jgi:hypothetical protein